jgi:ABC-2 type transport system permease protein
MSDDAPVADSARARAAGRGSAGTTPPGFPGALLELWIVARLEIAESMRARWFPIYVLVFGGIVTLLFIVTYIQICMAVLPVFVLVTTVRSVAGDREAGVFEYLLALPVGLFAWYWGRLAARFAIVFLPAFFAMLGASAWARIQEIPVPWALFTLYSAMLLALCACFLGIGMLISAFARSVDLAQGAALVVWLLLVLFLDLVLLGVLIEERAPAEAVVSIALANPLQVFRTAAMMLFDPNLVLLGPSAFVILDAFGRNGYLAWAVGYPTALGVVSAAAGFLRFRSGDLP